MGYLKQPESDVDDLNLVPMRRRVKAYLDFPYMLSWREQGQIYRYINFILQVYQLSKHAFAPNIFSPVKHVGYYMYSLLKVINVRIFPTDFMYGLHFIARTSSNDFPKSFNLLLLSP